MLESLDAHKNEDCSDKPWLMHAPVNTDDVESLFGGLDRNFFRLSKATSFVAVAGLSSMQMMHSCQDKVERDRRAANKAHKAGVDAASVHSWDLTHWYSVPQYVRKRIYCTLNSADDRTRRREEELAQISAHSAEQLDRKREEAAVSKRRHMNKRMAYEKSLADSKTKLATNVSELEAMMKGKSRAQQCEVLRDQLRLREILFGIPKPILIGSGSSDGELKRLREGVEPLVAQGLPAKMRPAPSPVPPRQPVAIPSEQSRELTGKHVARQFDAFRELLQLTGGGVFRLPPLPSEAEDRASTPRQWRRRQPNRREEGMMGQEFADEDVWWKVLSCEWSEEYECIIVYYYDVHWAEDDGLTEEQLRADLEHGCIQFSTVDEVTKWIKASEA
jgi:hypothetical protein